MEDEGWFYADMERKEAETKCKNTGDYLIRYSLKQNKNVLTVNWAGQVKHVVIQETLDVRVLKEMYIRKTLVLYTFNIYMHEYIYLHSYNTRCPLLRKIFD